LVLNQRYFGWGEFVSSSNTPDDPYENPYEAHAGSQAESLQESGFRSYEAEDFRTQMPPVERSYWFGILILLALSLVGYFCGDYLFGTVGPPLTVVVIGVFIALAMWMSVTIPFALIRLGVHRWNIAKAIENGRYPGTQRFGLWYLISSIIFSWLCLFAGGILFFGICLAILATNPNNSNNASAFLLVGDGLLSFLFAGFLFKLGVPRYR
jgi:hypothetical protein